MGLKSLSVAVEQAVLAPRRGGSELRPLHLHGCRRWHGKLQTPTHQNPNSQLSTPKPQTPIPLLPNPQPTPRSWSGTRWKSSFFPHIGACQVRCWRWFSNKIPVSLPHILRPQTFPPRRMHLQPLTVDPSPRPRIPDTDLGWRRWRRVKLFSRNPKPKSRILFLPNPKFFCFFITLKPRVESDTQRL